MFKVGDIVVRTYNNPMRKDLIVGNHYTVADVTKLKDDRIWLKGVESSAFASNFQLDKNTIVTNILRDL